jgi:UrcA family protein
MNTTIRNGLHAALYGALAAAALSTVSTVGAAQETIQTTKTVRYADLDIQNPTDAKTLYHRIRVAARDVCDTHSRDWFEREAGHACIERATDDAVRKVNAPALTKLRFGDDVRLASK